MHSSFNKSVLAGIKGQSSVEYLFVLVFLVGFVIAVVLPSIKEAEMTLALASAAVGAQSFESENPQYLITEINYTVFENTVTFHPKTYLKNATLPTTPLAQPPAGLSKKILDAVQSSVAHEKEGACVKGANNKYCV